MRYLKNTGIFLLCYLFVAFFASQVPAQQNKKGGVDAPSPQPMVIKSDSLVVDDANKVVTFSGQVSAEREDFTIDCDKMFVYYHSSGSNSPADAMGSKITKIVAEGHVKIQRKAGGEALAQHAEYYEGEDKVVLTGDPMVKQGKDFVQGDKITIFLKESKSIVESSPQKKVKAVIYPKKEPK